MRKNKVRSRTRRKNKGSLQTYLHIHAHALFSSLGRLVRTPLTSLMTIAVMAIAISLAAGFFLLIINIQQVTANLEASNQLSLFLKPSVSDSVGQQLADQIRKKQSLSQVILISKAQALEEFKTYSGFGDALKVLKTNPLPTVIQLVPNNSLNVKAIKQLKEEFSALPPVDFVQLDMQWVKRLQSIIQVIERGVLVLTLLLSVAVLFITGNTIRLELQNRRDEVLVAKLVGATYAFIQRPFLYTGFWLGFCSGFVAWLLVTVIMLILQAPIEQLSLLYDGSLNLLYLNIIQVTLLLLIASFLGVFGAWIVLHFQLHQIKPK